MQGDSAAGRAWVLDLVTLWLMLWGYTQEWLQVLQAPPDFAQAQAPCQEPWGCPKLH